MESIFNNVWSVRSLSLAQLSIKHYGIVYEVDDASEEKPIGILPLAEKAHYAIYRIHVFSIGYRAPPFASGIPYLTSEALFSFYLK